MTKLDPNPNANPTDIVGSLDTRGINSRYDSISGIAPALDFYGPDDERDLGIDEDGKYEVLADTEPGDVEAREHEAYRRSLLSETVASVLPGASSHPYSKGQEETKSPEVHDLLNPKEGGAALEKGPDPDAEVVSIEGEDDDRPARERAAAEAGRQVLEGNPQDILRAEGSGDDHTVSTGLDDPQTSTTPRDEQDGAPDDIVIDVTSDAAGPDGVVTGEDAEASIEDAKAARDGDPADSDADDAEDEDDDETTGEALPDGWEDEWTNEQMLDAARERGIEGVNTGSKKAELIAALKEWQG